MTKQILADPNELIFIQSRAETNHDLVDEYAAMMQDGVQFDAAHGILDEASQIFVHDGLHRGEAAKLTGIRLLVEVQSGTRQDAEWLALSANQKHGLRRSRKDKQRIVRHALLHPYGVSLSDREIARHCGVDHKTVGKIRTELETTGEIPQLDKRIVKKASGEIYEIDTTNIGGSRAEYVPVWKLETAIRQWLDETFEGVAEQRQALAEIKDKTPAGRRHLSQLLSTNRLPSPKRKRDVVQACHNVVDQLRSKPQLAPPNFVTLESSPGAWAAKVSEPKPQEFECPRCRQEKIVGVNGSRRWCLNCLAEWPNPTAFLTEVEASEGQLTNLPTRQQLQERFVNILARLDEQDHQLGTINAWLDRLEAQLELAEDNETDAMARQLEAPRVMEYA